MMYLSFMDNNSYFVNFLFFYNEYYVNECVLLLGPRTDVVVDNETLS